LCFIQLFYFHFHLISVVVMSINKAFERLCSFLCYFFHLNIFFATKHGNRLNVVDNGKHIYVYEKPEFYWQSSNESMKCWWIFNARTRNGLQPQSGLWVIKSITLALCRITIAKLITTNLLSAIGYQADKIIDVRTRYDFHNFVLASIITQNVI
jgi:hypothetical protein